MKIYLLISILALGGASACQAKTYTLECPYGSELTQTVVGGDIKDGFLIAFSGKMKGTMEAGGQSGLPLDKEIKISSKTPALALNQADNYFSKMYDPEVEGLYFKCPYQFAGKWGYEGVELIGYIQRTQCTVNEDKVICKSMSII